MFIYLGPLDIYLLIVNKMTSLAAIVHSDTCYTFFKITLFSLDNKKGK